MKFTCPPEDAGGPYSYLEYLEAIANPEYPGYGELIGWRGDPFGATAFDLLSTECRMQSRHTYMFG